MGNSNRFGLRGRGETPTAVIDGIRSDIDGGGQNVFNGKREKEGEREGGGRLEIDEDREGKW